MEYRRFQLGLIMGVMLSCSIGGMATGAEPGQRPNIILCMTDDQGWGDVGFNGLKKIATPNLDAMAATGLRLDRFYAQPCCSPTRAGIMTGRHSNRMGVFFPGMPIRTEECTIAQLLQKAGYRTGHFGKWHLNGVSGPGKVIKADDPRSPLQLGFDESFSVSNYFETDWTFSRNGVAEKTTGDGSEVIVTEALKFIRKAAADKRPFFAVVWFGSPHIPHKPLPADLAAAGGSGYYGELVAVDRSIGTLRSGLRKAAVADDTLLWFNSDNGGWLQAEKPDANGTNKDLRGHKGQVWEGGIRVPCVIEWPAVIKKPAVSSVPAATLDIFPTLAEITAVKPTKTVPLDGVSLVPLIEGRMNERPQPIGAWQLAGKAEKISSNSGPAAWIDNRYKLVKPQADQWELYDLTNDHTESKDLAAQQPEVLKRMKAELEAWQQSVIRSFHGEDYPSSRSAEVHFGNGIKIGEVDATSAIIWTRLTKTPERRADGVPFQDDDDKVPTGRTLADMKDSLPGTVGKVRLRYHGKDGAESTTPWLDVDPQRDFQAQIRLTGLKPATAYALTLEGRSPGADSTTATCTGEFHTAPAPSDPAALRFVVVTCADFPRRDDGDRGHLIYPSMARLTPDFFIHTGDIEYYDRGGPLAKNQELARFKWNRLFSLEHQRDFHRKVPSYFMKDDHDTLKNDCWPGQTFGDLTWEQGLAIFREQFPLGEKPYRTVRWGKDLQIWMIEGREFRSPNNLPDGPEKSILGAEQKKWLFNTMRASDAAFRIVVSATPIVGPDRGEKNDNHANKGFTHEGDELRTFLSSLPNTFTICGDRHWQYVSRDAKTGLTEFSVGPGSDSHAGGFTMNQRGPEHRFLRIQGGFLSVEVKRKDGQPHITFLHHDVRGTVVHEEHF